jgi:hypothetical protein
MTRRSTWAAAAVGAAAVLLVVVLVVNPFSGSPAGPGTSGALFGAFVQPGSRTGPDRRAAVTSFEPLIGRPLAMERVFYRWDEPWPTADDVWTRDAGRGRAARAVARCRGRPLFRRRPRMCALGGRFRRVARGVPCDADAYFNPPHTVVTSPAPG